MTEIVCPHCKGIKDDWEAGVCCALCHGTGKTITDHTINKQIEELHGHLKEKLVEKVEEEKAKTNMEKYYREVKTGVFIDVYDVLSAFDVNNPAVAHAVKKLLAPGKRGYKSKAQDLKEAIVSINRAINLEEENERKAN